jgi:hypothetical protein
MTPDATSTLLSWKELYKIAMLEMGPSQGAARDPAG